MTSTSPDHSNDRAKSAVIVKIGAIGDAVMALPLARELKSQGFNRITWVAGADIAPILAFVPEITDVILINERALFGISKFVAIKEVLKTWWRLRHLRSQTIFLLHADRRYRLLVPPWLSASIQVVRIGSRRHHTFDYARLAHPKLEDNALEFQPYTLPKLGARSEVVCLFPGGAKNAMRDNPLRRWPLENYVKLCELLLAEGFNIAIVGGPSDQWIEPAFARLKSMVDWRVGTMKLNETVEFLRHAGLAVSHDTGPVHLASLADCPIVTIFGPTNSEWFAPLKYKHLVLEQSPKLPCQPCYDGKDFGFCTNNLCISQITPDQVFKKIQLATSFPK